MNDLKTEDAQMSGQAQRIPAALKAQSAIAQAIMDGQGQLATALQALAESIAKPKKRIPVRDKKGDILHVIEAPDDAPAATETIQ